MKAKFDIPRLQALARHFHNISNLRVAIFDDEFVFVTIWPVEECAFCELVGNRESIIECNVCLQDDFKGFRESRKYEGAYHYVCHAGLDKVILPIRLNGLILAYLVMGQMAVGARDEIRERIYKRCENFNLDKKRMDEAFDSINIFDWEHVLSAAEVMRSCISHMCLSEQIKPVEGDLADVLVKYINDNLTGDLSVENLCSVMGVSRYALYRLSEEHFGMGIASYIRKTRIRAAIKLLSQKHSVMETARRCGFEDYNYFSKVFKRETGVPPVEYWKKSQSEEKN